MSEYILLNGTRYDVPRAVTAQGSADAWFAGQLLACTPEKALARMTRAELEAESARVGVAAAAPADGGDLVNADFIRAIEAHRADLASLAAKLPSSPAAALMPAGMVDGTHPSPEGAE